MILIGQYDSPFVRRVGIALRLYGIPFTHEPWSAFGDADRLRRHNPLTRVPTLVLDDGESLIDSATILDHLDSLAPPGRALVPASEPARRRVLKVTALATGLGDKAVSIFYERRLHETVSDVWIARCRKQMGGALAALEAGCAELTTPYWFGDAISHADIAVVCVLRFIADALPGVAPIEDTPALAAFAARLEALPVFREISQPFVPPA